MGWTGHGLRFLGRAPAALSTFAGDVSDVIWEPVRAAVEAARPWRSVYESSDAFRGPSVEPHEGGPSAPGSTRSRRDGRTETELTWWFYDAEGSSLVQHLWTVSLAAHLARVDEVAAKAGTRRLRSDTLPTLATLLGPDVGERYFEAEGALVRHRRGDDFVILDPLRRAHEAPRSQLTEAQRRRLAEVLRARVCMCPLCAELRARDAHLAPPADPGAEETRVDEARVAAWRARLERDRGFSTSSGYWGALLEDPVDLAEAAWRELTARAERWADAHRAFGLDAAPASESAPPELRERARGVVARLLAQPPGLRAAEELRSEGEAMTAALVGLAAERGAGWAPLLDDLTKAYLREHPPGPHDRVRATLLARMEHPAALPAVLAVIRAALARDDHRKRRPLAKCLSGSALAAMALVHELLVGEPDEAEVRRELLTTLGGPLALEYERVTAGLRLHEDFDGWVATLRDPAAAAVRLHRILLRGEAAEPSYGRLSYAEPEPLRAMLRGEDPLFARLRASPAERRVCFVVAAVLVLGRVEDDDARDASLASLTAAFQRETHPGVRAALAWVALEAGEASLLRALPRRWLDDLAEQVDEVTSSTSIAGLGLVLAGLLHAARARALPPDEGALATLVDEVGRRSDELERGDPAPCEETLRALGFAVRALARRAGRPTSDGDGEPARILARAVECLAWENGAPRSEIYLLGLAQRERGQGS